MSVVHITNQNFEAEVLASEQTVLLDFYADWCGPCRMLSPTLEQIAKEHPEIKIGKVNTDEEGELSEQFGIMNIPTLVVIKEGKIVNQASGVRPKAAILEMLV